MLFVTNKKNYFEINEQKPAYFLQSQAGMFGGHFKTFVSNI